VFTIANWKDLPNDGWFVDSTAGTDAAGYGYNPDAPLATLDAAFTYAAAGDKVYVAPWHVENITTAIGVEANVAGVTVEGVRMGNLMPTFTMTAAAGSITVSAANVTLRNLKLVAEFTNGCAAALTIPVTGAGCTLDGIVCRDTTNAKEWLLHVTVAALVTDLTIKNCSFVGLIGGTMTNSILFAGASTNTIIEDNYIFVDSSDDVIDHLAGASINLVVRRNVIINHDADAAGYCLRYKSDGTGVAHHNLMGYREVNAEIGIGAGAWWFENYATNTIGTSSGVLDPAAGAAVP
jgi:hypothetical protein